MHGTNAHRIHNFEAAPAIGGINSAPCADDDEARAKRERRRLALLQRPHALESARFVLDLQQFETRPPPVNASDVARRELSLKRASALAETMPDGWPNPPMPEPRPYLDAALERKIGRPRGPHSRRAQRDDDDGDDFEPAPRNLSAPHRKGELSTERVRAWRAKQGRQPEQPIGDFPLTLAAAMAREGSAWNLGDAIIAETGAPGKNHIKTGNYARIEAARQFLAARGIVYTFDCMIKLRDIAFNFPAPLRRYSFTIHHEALNPRVLDDIVAGLPAGQKKLTAAYVRQQIRARNGKTPPGCPGGKRPYIVEMVPTP